MEEFNTYVPANVRSKKLYLLITGLFLLNFLAIGINFAFIYYPEIKYSPQVKNIFTEIESGLSGAQQFSESISEQINNITRDFKSFKEEVQNFIQETRPVLVQIQDFINNSTPALNIATLYICQSEPELCSNQK